MLVHGFRGDHHGLEGIAKSLSRALPELRIVVPDLPGFGSTPPIADREHNLTLYGEWLRAFVAALAGGTKYVTLGHSFGSLVVSEAIAQGLSPSRLILVNPISSPALEGPQAVLTRLAVAYYRAADWLPERVGRALLAHPLIVRGMSEVMARTSDRELRRWIHTQHHSYFSEFDNTTTLTQAFAASVSHTVMQFAAQLDMPTLIIAGERDDIAPLEHQLRLQRRLANAQLVVIAHSGHLVHYEAVADTVASISSFLRNTTGESIRQGATRGKTETGA